MAGKKRRKAPVDLSPEVQRVVVDAVAGGMPQKHAAQRANVTDRAVRLWMARGAKEKTGKYRSFHSAMKKAEADRLAASVARIGRAAAGGHVVERVVTTTTKKDGTTTTKTVEKVQPPQWTADAWFLERRHPDEFAGNRREVLELRRQLAAILKGLADGKLGGAAAEGAAAHGVGGDADPDAV